MKNFDFTKLEFTDKNRGYKLTNLFLGSTVFGLFPANVVRLKNKSYGSGDAPLDILGEAIGIEDQKIINGLKYHQSRLIFHIVFVSLTASIVSFCGLYLSLASIDILKGNLFNAASPQPLLITGNLLLASLYLLSFYIALSIGLRISAIIVNRYFADTLCILALFHILFSLQQDDVLYVNWKKRVLLKRTHYLVKHISLLALSYQNDITLNKTAEEHFNSLISYITLRQSWIVAPKKTTPSDLRKDFYELTLIFTSGNYGDFNPIEKDAQEKSPSVPQNFSATLLRFLGFVFPIVLLSLYLWQPNYFSFVVIDRNIVALTLFAWFMLSVDSFFKLGLVASLVELIKTVKELA